MSSRIPPPSRHARRLHPRPFRSDPALERRDCDVQDGSSSRREMSRRLLSSSKVRRFCKCRVLCPALSSLTMRARMPSVSLVRPCVRSRSLPRPTPPFSPRDEARPCSPNRCWTQWAYLSCDSMTDAARMWTALARSSADMCACRDAGTVGSGSITDPDGDRGTWTLVRAGASTAVGGTVVGVAAAENGGCCCCCCGGGGADDAPGDCGGVANPPKRRPSGPSAAAASTSVRSRPNAVVFHGRTNGRIPVSVREGPDGGSATGTAVPGTVGAVPASSSSRSTTSMWSRYGTCCQFAPSVSPRPRPFRRVEAVRGRLRCAGETGVDVRAPWS